MEVTIPPNTTATVVVPTSQPEAVTESGVPAAGASGVTPRGNEDAYAIFEVGSGRYAFEAPMEKTDPGTSEERED
jgi:alpha-L-rhamnosidase